MHIVSWKPWSKIPRTFQTLKQKVHTVLSFATAGWCLLYVGIAGLYTYFSNAMPTPKSAVAILLDTSISMSANDVAPNRYRHAISLATGLMQNYNASYITIPFGGLPLVRTPWSEDVGGIEKVLSQYNLGGYHVNLSYMGSAPGNAIGLAWDYLKKHPAQKKAIVLLGDGNTNTGYAIDAFLPYLVQEKIELLICALGDTENVIGNNHADSPIVNAIDLDRLTYITEQTNGKWWICNDKEESIGRLMLKLREGTLVNTHFSVSDIMRKLWATESLHRVTIGALLYILITSTRGFIRYIFYSEK